MAFFFPYLSLAELFSASRFPGAFRELLGLSTRLAESAYPDESQYLAPCSMIDTEERSYALASLPPKLRSIVHLRCFRQLTFAEIGRTLNMPEPTVKTYFYRSLPLTRRALAATATCHVH
ncbi:MAG TPA: sigma factor-like helix-turn-helix DNA-binding protein [Ktedonobacteraceae bacterium]|nr:sigma factor-like helix-turn-helix DNA-binding protein [Ktedonobacteraceae bacterium]